MSASTSLARSLSSVSHTTFNAYYDSMGAEGVASGRVSKLRLGRRDANQGEEVHRRRRRPSTARALVVPALRLLAASTCQSVCAVLGIILLLRVTGKVTLFALRFQLATRR